VVVDFGVGVSFLGVVVGCTILVVVGVGCNATVVALMVVVGDAVVVCITVTVVDGDSVGDGVIEWLQKGTVP